MALTRITGWRSPVPIVPPEDIGGRCSLVRLVKETGVKEKAAMGSLEVLSPISEMFE